MKKNKALGIVFALLAILLSDIMCAVVAFNYSNLAWGGQYAGYSAPVSTAFYFAIPYLIGIVICVVLSLFFCKWCNSSENN